jgi:class 3 adenylate cyclase
LAAGNTDNEATPQARVLAQVANDEKFGSWRFLVILKHHPTKRRVLPQELCTITMTISKPKTQAPSGVVTAMFTDIVDSTRLKGLMEGDTSARRDARFRLEIKDAHDAIILTCAREAGGYLVNPTGDGFCFTFVDAEEAVLCALRIQKNLQLQPIATPLGVLQVRIGLHTGMADPSGGDYIASTIDKTARVQGRAAGGEVIVSNQTYVLVDGRISGVEFETAGTFDLKGLRAEELYRATPTANLHLPPTVLGSPSAQRSAPPMAHHPASRGSHAFASAAVGVVVFLLLGAIGWALYSKTHVPATPDPSSLVSSATAPSGAATTSTPLSKWSGRFHFLLPISDYNGSAELAITKQDGDTFEGVYASENHQYEWLVEGTLRGRNIRWEFVKALKNPGSEDAVGNAYCEGVIEGNRLNGFFRMKNNPQERAELKLRRDP